MGGHLAVTCGSRRPMGNCDEPAVLAAVAFACRLHPMGYDSHVAYHAALLLSDGCLAALGCLGRCRQIGHPWLLPPSGAPHGLPWLWLLLGGLAAVTQWLSWCQCCHLIGSSAAAAGHRAATGKASQRWQAESGAPFRNGCQWPQVSTCPLALVGGTVCSWPHQ